MRFGNLLKVGFGNLLKVGFGYSTAFNCSPISPFFNLYRHEQLLLKTNISIHNNLIIFLKKVKQSMLN